VDPTASPTTWIDTSPTPEGMTLRVVAFLLILAISGIAALAARDALGRTRSEAGRIARGAIGQPVAPPWASRGWACGRCRSVTGHGRDRCQGCGAPRSETELHLPPAEPVPDVIPADITAGPGSLVMLEHNASAHEQALARHWLLRVNGVVAGSAANRDGALALLRAVRGVDTVMFDPHGKGYAPYQLTALVAAFEGPRLPYASPCPEAGQRHAPTRPR